MSDTLGKIQSTSQQIALKIKRDCQCTIDAAYITSGRLACDPQETTHVIYRARLSSTPDVSNTGLISFVQQWISGGSASVTLEHVQLNADASCTVVIDSFDDPICPAPAVISEPPNLPTANINNLYIIVTLAVVIFAIVLIAAVVCGIVIYQRKFSRKYGFR